jgi:hypothetical protein
MKCNTPEPTPPKTEKATGYDSSGECTKAQKKARQRAFNEAMKWALEYAPECPGNCKFRQLKVTFAFGTPPCKEDPRDKKKLEAVCTWTATVECVGTLIGLPPGKQESASPFLGLTCTTYFEDKGTGKDESPRSGDAKRGAERDAREQAEKATERLGISCLGETCPTSQITVSFGEPTTKIKKGADEHNVYEGTCDWKLIAECV